jgi:hypothetical protein
MLHERRNYKENNSKACNGMPKYNIVIAIFTLGLSSRDRMK